MDKKKEQFDIINNPEHHKTMIAISEILVKMISDVAIPQGIKKKNYMIICETIWDMCPYITE